MVIYLEQCASRVRPAEKERELADEEQEVAADIEISPQEIHRPYNMRVSDFRDQAWCEKQLEFTLTEGREQTAAMKAGSQRHVALHEEIAEVIKVEPRTREDMWGLHLWNSLAGLALLRETGLAREIPVIGQLPGYDMWIVGIIDELTLQEDGRLQLLDTKTRKRPSLPRVEQKYTTRVQMALYWRLFAQMARRELDEAALYRDLRLDPDAPFSPTMLEEMQTQGITFPNLRVFLPIVLDTFAAMPALHPELVVRYEWQEDQSLLGTDPFMYREDLLFERVHTFMQYWQGQRPAQGVAPREGWKCRFCQFREKCPVAA